jgi:hypothetical protein
MTSARTFQETGPFQSVSYVFWTKANGNNCCCRTACGKAFEMSRNKCLGTTQHYHVFHALEDYEDVRMCFHGPFCDSLEADPAILNISCIHQARPTSQWIHIWGRRICGMQESKATCKCSTVGSWGHGVDHHFRNWHCGAVNDFFNLLDISRRTRPRALLNLLIKICTRHRKKCFWLVERCRYVGLTNVPPSGSRLSRKFEIINMSKPYRPPQPVAGIALFYGDGMCFLWGTNLTVSTATSSQYLAVNCEPIV